MNTQKATKAWPLGSIVLLAWGAIGICVFLFIVPKFEQIYQDALPGIALPKLTTFIISGRFFLAFAALVWPIVAIIAVRQQLRAAIWIITLGHLYFLLMFGVTALALFAPMVSGVIVGR